MLIPSQGNRVLDRNKKAEAGRGIQVVGWRWRGGRGRQRDTRGGMEMEERQRQMEGFRRRRHRSGRMDTGKVVSM